METICFVKILVLVNRSVVLEHHPYDKLSVIS